MITKNIETLNAEEDALLKASRSAQNLSYAPYSKFTVGVSVQMQNGTILQGANQENAAYPMCLCGEQVALAHAKMSYPTEIIQAICISTPKAFDSIFPPSPCGACRQVISEYQNRQEQAIEIILDGGTVIYKFSSIADLLPYQFSSKNL